MDITKIKNPSFLNELDNKQLEQLANDIRNFIIESVSKTGGHLSSNLGVVELTIALHYCFNAPKDKILFDVGHQCYTHKILTGRAKDFSNLRKFKGISGFQKRRESKYDCFEAGHSSTALGASLGMAIARDLNKDNYEVVPVVGDGSIVSGLSLEALNQIGYEKRKVIIVFNDNNMSINKNVGILNERISKLRNSKSYNNLKSFVKKTLNVHGNGEKIIETIHNAKEFIKKGFINNNIFSIFGIYYIGPVDGHDIKALIRAFEVAKTKNGPVVVHCITEKGKGYIYSENDIKGKWHGVSSFDVKTGNPLRKPKSGYVSYSKFVADCVYKQMKSNKNIVAITPAMISGSCLDKIFNDFPGRCFDMGIAEDMAIELACGLSLSGKIPFVSIYSSFLQRAYDQLNHDVSRMNLPMVIGIDRASLVGADGETHHGVFDIGLVKDLPNCVIAQGKDCNEIKDLINCGFSYNGPFFIRYPRGEINITDFKDKYSPIKIGKWTYVLKNSKPKAIVISYGNEVNEVYDSLINLNLKVDLINARFIKPLDEKMLINISKYKVPIYVYTSDNKHGGLAQDILSFYNSNNINVKLISYGIDDMFVTHGSNEQLKKYLHIDVNTLIKDIKSNIK